MEFLFIDQSILESFINSYFIHIHIYINLNKYYKYIIFKKKPIKYISIKILEINYKNIRQIYLNIMLECKIYLHKNNLIFFRFIGFKC